LFGAPGTDNVLSITGKWNRAVIPLYLFVIAAR
jgi:hypothetical protein